MLDRELALLCGAGNGGMGSSGANDPFLLYLWGVVLSDLKRTTDSARCFARSVEIFPCNWAAWQAITVSSNVL